MNMDYPGLPNIASVLTRRNLLRKAGLGAVAIASSPAIAETMIRLPFEGGSTSRHMTRAFPQKGPMILQRSRPPLLETPREVFDKGVFTPNDQFYVRWHWAGIPTEIDVDTFKLAVHGHVVRPLSLSLRDLMRDFPRVELAAVNQCSGNSRGLFQPRVPGAQWANGAMGNALWAGVPLKNVLDRAGIKSGAIQVRFSGVDEPVVPSGPHFEKSLDIDHARDGEVMIAYAMNGEPLPLLNGFPLRLVVPGWYATYWVKSLSNIEVLEQEDENFWTKKAYLIPDTPRANVVPGQSGIKMIPINRMVPRSFVTNLETGAKIQAGSPTNLRGIAFGGDSAVARVDVSTDQGRSWQSTDLGADSGTYGFRQWTTKITAPTPRNLNVMVRCTNRKDEVQPDTPNWNPSGFMRNVIEAIDVAAV
jgi:DMSO/TMAO reductase YedYZ molybdopterin-dependent catalytic subunit